MALFKMSCRFPLRFVDIENHRLIQKQGILFNFFEVPVLYPTEASKLWVICAMSIQKLIVERACPFVHAFNLTRYLKIFDEILGYQNIVTDLLKALLDNSRRSNGLPS
jgi:hypothetical protein